MGSGPKLVRYIENGTRPISNNPCENAIRPFVVGRRNFLFCDTVAGANASASLYSLVETCKADTMCRAAISSRRKALPHSALRSRRSGVPPRRRGSLFLRESAHRVFQIVLVEREQEFGISTQLSAVRRSVLNSSFNCALRSPMNTLIDITRVMAPSISGESRPSRS